MQAVVIGSGITTELAEKFYSWLRASVSAPTGDAPNSVANVQATASVATPAVGADTPSDGGGDKLNSSAPQEAAPPSSAHAGKWTPRQNEPPHE